MTKRSPYEFDGPVSLAAGAQRTRKKKRRESPSDRDTEANEAWLASVLLPAQQNKTLQPAQRNEVDVRTQPLMMEKREVQAQAHMSVEVLEQKEDATAVSGQDRVHQLPVTAAWAFAN
ncbi:hypothetical protein Pcac1_g29142 [Phytophthora cactorum]|nr:hypothetical protein Pcac1_g29142 [Phytophthora cactorum]